MVEIKVIFTLFLRRLKTYNMEYLVTPAAIGENSGSFFKQQVGLRFFFPRMVSSVIVENLKTGIVQSFSKEGFLID